MTPRDPYTPWKLWAALALALIALPIACQTVQAKPVFQSSLSGGRISVVLHDEPCTVAGSPKNLRWRGTWVEDGKVYEGCWGFFPNDIVVMYFDDGTATAIPAQLFRQASNT